MYLIPMSLSDLMALDDTDEEPQFDCGEDEDEEE